MKVIRPIAYHDLPALERLAVVSGGSLTTLPANRDHLSEIIGKTQQSLKLNDQHDQGYNFHFVLEDSDSGELLGISGIESKAGITSPFYSYRIAKVMHRSRELQINNPVPTLTICQDLAASTRLCTLFLAPEHRSRSNHQLLSRSRFMFMALHRQLFADQCIAELQGVNDEQGKSPFWESLGRHFFSMELSRATYLAGINFKGFIASLMPQQPIYTTLLGEDAQQALGKPRADVLANRLLLEQEGFEFQNHIDIFDAGPTLEICTDNIHTFSAITETTALSGENNGAEPYLISNSKCADYRCVIANLTPQEPLLNNDQMNILNVNSGDNIQLSPLYQEHLIQEQSHQDH